MIQTERTAALKICMVLFHDGFPECLIQNPSEFKRHGIHPQNGSSNWEHDGKQADFGTIPCGFWEHGLTQTSPPVGSLPWDCDVRLQQTRSTLIIFE